MKTLTRNCEQCDKLFDAPLKEINRGNGKYCSLSCAAKNQRKHSEILKAVCKHCGQSFDSKSTEVKYCSYSCKQKNYRLKAKVEEGLSMKTFNRIFKDVPCEVCGWTEAPRDLHHIVAVSDGGKTDMENLVCLCPNHHRMAHHNLVSQDDLLKIAQQRTISSPLLS